ncbi:MAG: VWA domain-containing protein [Bacteroidales bacterium]
MTFANPDFLFLLLIIIPLIGWYWWRQRRLYATLQISTIQPFRNLSLSYKQVLRHVLFALRMVAVSLFIIALARPQSSDAWEDSSTEGIDIVMALDLSSSMLARDFEPNRLDASKNLAMEFITGRPNDRIGLVVFAGESFTQCPLTTDHAVVLNLFKDLKSGLVEDGTAIGMGLATSVSRLKDSKATSKVIILLTDGVNNAGEISPMTAAEIAQTFNIRIYTIGVGSMGTAPYPVQTPFGLRYQNMKVEIDEDVLQQVAESTGGSYFRATDNNKLREIYTRIDEMEKSKMEVKKYRKKNEEFIPFLLLALGILLIEVLTRYTVLRSIP